MDDRSRRYRRHQLLMMSLAALAFFASAPGQSFIVSVFVDDFLAGTGLSRAVFSTLYALGTVVSATAMLVLGRVVDRHGLRAAWAAVAVALALACGLASVAAGVVTAFLALALLRTSGQGSFTLVGTLIIARAFERRRGQAMAVANLGLVAASVVLPPSVVALILAVGWRQAYQVIGLVLLLAVLPLAALLRTGPPRVVTGEDHDDAAAFPAATRRSRRLPRLSVPTRQAAKALLVLAAAPLVGTAVTFHAVSILGERGLSFVQAGFALSVLGAASAVGTVGVGVFADRVSTRTLLVGTALAVLAGSWALLVPSAATAYAAFAGLGIGLGATSVVNGTVWARTYGLAQIGRIQGTAQSSMITSAAVAPLVPAFSQAATDGYVAGLVLLGCFTVLALLVAVSWRDPRSASAATT